MKRRAKLHREGDAVVAEIEPRQFAALKGLLAGTCNVPAAVEALGLKRRGLAETTVRLFLQKQVTAEELPGCVSSFKLTARLLRNACNRLGLSEAQRQEVERAIAEQGIR